MMKETRASLLDSGAPIDAGGRAALLEMTSRFERLIWLLNQISGSLEAGASAKA
jgi:hypothetical protein